MSSHLFGYDEPPTTPFVDAVDVDDDARPDLLIFVPDDLTQYQTDRIRDQLDERPSVVALPANSVVYQFVEGQWMYLHDTSAPSASSDH